MRYDYQHNGKLGCLQFPSILVVQFLGTLSSSDLRSLAVIVASDVSSFGDAIIDGHPVLLDRSASTRHVVCDMLLKTT